MRWWLLEGLAQELQQAGYSYLLMDEQTVQNFEDFIKNLVQAAVVTPDMRIVILIPFQTK